MRLRSTLLAFMAAAMAATASAAAPNMPRAPDNQEASGTTVAALRRYPRNGPAPRQYPEPRRNSRSRAYRPPIVTQVSAGFYNPNGASATSALYGVRVSQLVDPQVQLGVMLDWVHKVDRVSATFGHETVGGVDLSYEDSRLRGRSDLVPLLAFVQVSGRDTGRAIPYAGFAAGYEFLSMEADRPDGTRFDGSFGGWGWQAWAGAAMSISDQARLSGEVFVNRADLSRDVGVDGRVLRQSASFNGPGVRLGVAWGF
jgi:hypothetical protein